MTTILTRLLPGVRDLRISLAVGYSWVAVVWSTLLLTGNTQGNDVASFFSEATEGFPSLALVSGVTFLTTMLGSGIARLMDRLMVLSRPQDGPDHETSDWSSHVPPSWRNPLDRREPFPSERLKWLQRGMLRPYFEATVFGPDPLNIFVFMTEQANERSFQSRGDGSAGLDQWRNADYRSFRLTWQQTRNSMPCAPNTFCDTPCCGRLQRPCWCRSSLQLQMRATATQVQSSYQAR